AVVEALLELELGVPGVIAKRGIACARIGVVVAAGGEGEVVRDRRRIPGIGAALTVRRTRDPGESTSFVEIQLPRDEVDGGTGRVGSQDARAAALEGFDVVDGNIVLEHLVIVQAAIDGRHAVLDEPDELVSAAGPVSNNYSVRD